jgi:hypothetical protein
VALALDTLWISDGGEFDAGAGTLVAAAQLDLRGRGSQLTTGAGAKLTVETLTVTGTTVISGTQLTVTGYVRMLGDHASLELRSGATLTLVGTASMCLGFCFVFIAFACRLFLFPLFFTLIYIH